MKVHYFLFISQLVILNVTQETSATFVRNTWQEMDYSLERFCNVTSGLYDSLPSRKSVLQCAIFCSTNESCCGFTYNNDFSCDFFVEDLWYHNCSNVSTVMLQMEENCSSNALGLEGRNCSVSAFVKTSTRRWNTQCLNQGSLTPTNTCVCVDGWVGDRCNRIMEDCIDGQLIGNYTEDKRYLIQPALAPKPFKVFCQMSSDPALLRIQVKVSTNTSFNKTWQEFKDGFDFSPQDDFWLGNDNIHYITSSQTYALVIFVLVGDLVHQRYLYDFLVANETEGYAVTYTEAYSNSSMETYLGSCWGNESIKFSTHDQDNDGMMSTNCASEFGAGWWFQSPNCSLCNPNGDLYLNMTERLGIPSENFWTTDPFNTSSPDAVWMALSRI